ncbi:MAG: serine/threonine-protein kinase [Planctomycetales bacterium]|nr:serine/threonine-protein kinase [Planctomycetales bacterium]
MSDGPASTRFGPWEILEEIGRGGYGAVYRARHSRTGAVAAVKVILAGEGATPDEIRRFQREIALARTLDHPGIVRVLDVGEEGARAWFAMEYVEGRSLWATLTEESLPWRRAVEIARDVADALGHAHARGILHRDLKSANILIGRKVVAAPSRVQSSESRVGSEEPNSEPRTLNSERPFLTDFGLARLASTGSRLTRTGFAIGTPDYMSPEQARGERDRLGPATDVWSLGCILYEMLAGRLPFEGSSSELLVEAVVAKDPTPIGRLREDLPAGLDRVIRVCLAKDASDRYRDGWALRDDLDRVLRGERPLARPPRGPALVRALVLSGLVMAAALWGGWPAREGPGPVPPPAPDAPRSPPATGAPPRAEGLAARAMAVRHSDPTEAARLLEAAIASSPDHARGLAWRLERGLVLWAVGRASEALEEWRGIPAGAPEAKLARFYEGLEAFFALRTADSLRVLSASASLGGRAGNLADAAVFAVARDWRAAREVLRGEPGWEAALLRGYVEHHDPSGDREAAIREYGVALADGIPFGWAYGNRANLRQEAGDLAGARADYDEALRLDPGLVLAWNNRAAFRFALGDREGARADVEQALRLDPSYGHAWHNRGLMRGESGDLRGALEDASEAVRLEPLYAAAWNNRSLARLRLGDVDGAIADADEALRLDPSEAKTWINRGNARGTRGDVEGAIADLDEGLRRNPRLLDGYMLRAFARRLGGDLEGAAADLARALELAPPDWPRRAEAERLLKGVEAAVRGSQKGR